MSLSIEDTLAVGIELQATQASGSADALPRVPALERLGRYVVLSKLGAGAMGVVLAAYDPELDRKVALKLLAGQSNPNAQARLKREAQALAKLDHPNVVGVHDVGTHEGHLFVSMDLVAGQTLRAWMDAVDHPRPWREVVEVFIAAGRGLAAAHEVGLIHRDFKPDNVMLGDDGRVRVMDFGLARTLDIAGSESVSSTRTEASQPLNTLTRTGTLLGTPAYMSAELYAGRPSDARSDQFGFCVALYEALHGRRPFAGNTVYELILALETEQIDPPPKGSSVPAWLRAVVVRGLAREPERRWPSMTQLLAALTLERDRDLRVSGRARGLFVLAMSSAAAGVALLVAWLERSGRFVVTHAHTLVALVLFTTATALAVYGGRRWLLRNTVNRRFSLSAVTAPALFTLMHALTWLLGAPLLQAVVSDFVIACAGLFAVAVFTEQRLLLLTAGVFALGAAVLAALPGHFHEIFAAVILLATMPIVVLWIRADERNGEAPVIGGASGGEAPPASGVSARGGGRS